MCAETKIYLLGINGMNEIDRLRNLEKHVSALIERMNKLQELLNKIKVKK